MKRTLISLLAAATLALGCATTAPPLPDKCHTTPHTRTVTKNNLSTEITYNRPFNGELRPECSPYDSGSVKFLDNGNLDAEVNYTLYITNPLFIKALVHRPGKEDVVCELYNGKVNCPGPLGQDPDAKHYSDLGKVLIGELIEDIHAGRK